MAPKQPNPATGRTSKVVRKPAPPGSPTRRFVYGWEGEATGEGGGGGASTSGTSSTLVEEESSSGCLVWKPGKKSQTTYDEEDVEELLDGLGGGGVRREKGKGRAKEGGESSSSGSASGRWSTETPSGGDPLSPRDPSPMEEDAPSSCQTVVGKQAGSSSALPRSRPPPPPRRPPSHPTPRDHERPIGTSSSSQKQPALGGNNSSTSNTKSIQNRTNSSISSNQPQSSSSDDLATSTSNADPTLSISQLSISGNDRDRDPKRPRREQEQHPSPSSSAAPLKNGLLEEDDPMDGRKTDLNPISIMCWNVSGLEEIMQNEEAAFFEFIDINKPDMIVLQNHKVAPPPYIPDSCVDPFEKRGYYGWWWNNTKWPFPGKGRTDIGHLGVVIFSKCRLPTFSNQLEMIGSGYMEGRLMVVEFNSFILVATLFPEPLAPAPPDASETAKQLFEMALRERVHWHQRLREILPELDAVKPVIIAGSFAVDLDDISPKNRSVTHIDTFQANGRMLKILKSSVDRHTQPFVDIQRRLAKSQPVANDLAGPTLRLPPTYENPKDTRSGGPNTARYDGFLVSTRLVPRVKECWTNADQRGTLHRPVVLELAGVYLPKPSDQK